MKTCTNCPGATDHSTAECWMGKDRELLEMLMDAIGYGAYYQELVARDSGMAVAKESQADVMDDSSVRAQAVEWLKAYRESNP